MTTTNHTRNYECAMAYHRRIPDRIREYLHRIGIADPAICRYRLGWNGDQITIPITNRFRQIAFFKYARDPESDIGPDLTASLGTSPELFGWERLVFGCERIVICEGEFDRLLLEVRGFPAVTSTAGPGVFLPEWGRVFQDIPHVYICFHNNAAGTDYAGEVAHLIPHACILQLPEEIGLGGTMADFFVRLGKTEKDFEYLLERTRAAAINSQSDNA